VAAQRRVRDRAHRGVPVDHRGDARGARAAALGPGRGPVRGRTGPRRPALGGAQAPGTALGHRPHRRDRGDRRTGRPEPAGHRAAAGGTRHPLRMAADPYRADGGGVAASGAVRPGDRAGTAERVGADRCESRLPDVGGDSEGAAPGLRRAAPPAGGARRGECPGSRTLGRSGGPGSRRRPPDRPAGPRSGAGPAR
jgi:hypothetical protein